MEKHPDFSVKTSTLVRLLRERAENEPDFPVFCFLEQGEREGGRMTFGDLDRRARSIALLLEEQGKRGEPVLLLYEPSLEYIAGLFACFYAGMIAVPAYPPQLDRTLTRVESIILDAKARIALTTGSILSQLDLPTHPVLSPLQWIVTDTVSERLASAWVEPKITEDDLAVLQYTSGSTGEPKGTMLTHRNLVYQLEVLERRFRRCENPDDEGGICWLPPYHDMGLIGGVLITIYGKGRGYWMQPIDFLFRPIRWLQAISKYRVSVSGGPNFAYEQLIERTTPKQREGLDLSSWKVAACGAEPLRAETIRRFLETFEPYGFHPEAFYPCYGLAEATLMVSGTEVARPPVIASFDREALDRNRAVARPADHPGARALVGSGTPLSIQETLIVDPASLLPCADGEIGEIWVAGPCVAKGYWNRPEATKEVFEAYLANGRGPFLRTGDLGFLDQGELYVTGRLKDLMIIRGRNLYPHDIEQTVTQSDPKTFRPDSGAVFSIDVADEERLVVVQEVTRPQRIDPEAVIETIRRTVAERHGVQVHAVALIRPGTLLRTSSGKIRRQPTKAAYLAGELDLVAHWSLDASKEEEAAHEAVASPQTPTPATPSGEGAVRIEAWLVREISRRMNVPPERIDIEEPFIRFGLDSAEAMALIADLEAWIGKPLSPTLVWDYPTIRALSRHLAGEETARPALRATVAAGERNEPLAIVGIGCRFPGAPDVAAFWRLLTEGGDAICEVPPDRFDVERFYHEDPSVPGKMNTRWGGFVEGIDRFDPHFFGISPREAARMDPQQRLLLEVAWEALEDAGIDPHTLAGTLTGVFIGISSNDYAHLQFADPTRIDPYAGTGNAHSIAANRLSYFLGLQGPSLAVDTACSSSLVALHLACQSIRQGECEVAIAGGVNVILNPAITINFAKAGAMAADGRCKAFDRRADGYVRGEGAGIVVLKPLSRALAEGDPIHALVLGSAVNQDGRSNGLMAPNRQAQVEVLRTACARAGVSPAEIEYVEAHGTGTLLGDPIEAAALGEVLAEGRDPASRCRIGSVKTNIGHLEAAAGVAGLIKTALAIQHRTLPASLHFERPNPHIPFEKLPIEVQRECTPWPGERRLAGVSSFGFGGTNAHVVLAPPPQRPERDLPEAAGEAHAALLFLSARDETSLRRRMAQFRDFLRESDAALHDICYTAARRRAQLPYRVAVVGKTKAAIASTIERHLSGEECGNVIEGRCTPAIQPRVVFVFPGQGSQWVGMGRDLLEREPVFSETFRACDRAISDEAGFSPLAVLTRNDPPLETIDVIQPLLFGFQVALAALWRSWGIEPAAVVGHSMGEVAAACVAGILSLTDAARVICRRSRLLRAEGQGGGMAVVGLPHTEVAALLEDWGDALSIAALNAPDSTVVAGAPEALEALGTRLQREEIFFRFVKIDVASHTPRMDPLLPHLAEALSGLRPRKGVVPICSAVTGDFHDGADFGAAYWVRNLREPVRFSPAVERLIEGGHDHFIEISPHPILTMAVAQTARKIDRRVRVHPSLKRETPARDVLLASAAAIHVETDLLDRSALFPEGRAVPLPPYPWNRERCWLEVPATPVGHSVHLPPLLGRVATFRSEVTLSLEAFPFLADHRIEGSILVPGTLFVEIATAAALHTFGETCRIEALRFEAPLLLHEGEEVRLTVEIRGEAPDCATLLIRSLAGEEGGGETTHVTARIVREAGEAIAPLDPETARTRFPETIERERFYRRLHEAGLEYGPTFQGIEELRCGTGCALARIEARHERVPAGMRCDPALLDACWQAIGAALPRDAHLTGPFLPAKIERFRSFQPILPPLWSHVELRSFDEDEIVADLSIHDAAGVGVAEVRGLHLRRIGGSSIEDIRRWGYRIEWRPSTSPPPAEAEGPLVLFCDRGGVGEALAHTLAGGEVIRITPGERFVAHADDRFEIAPGNEDDLARIVARWDRPGTRFLDLSPLDLPADLSGAITSVACAALSPILLRIQKISQGSYRIVTRAAQQVAGEKPQPLQALFWGLGRTALQEKPQSWGGMIDLDPEMLPEEAARLLAGEIFATDREKEVAWRGGTRFVSRLVRDPHPLSGMPVHFERAGTCLISGGLGDLGAAAADCLFDLGIRHFVLLGRTPLPPRERWATLPHDDPARPRVEKVRALEARGAAVLPLAGSVADMAFLERIPAKLEALDWPPIGGVIHAAGVLADRSIDRLDSAAFAEVFTPKGEGAWCLHRVFRKLDFFVIFSSAAGMLGSAGQGNYAAANAFADALVASRRAEGRPALSIAWGPFAEIGLAARPDRGGRLSLRGIRSIPPEQGMRALARLLATEIPLIGVIPFHWPSLHRFYGDMTLFPLLADLWEETAPLPEAEVEDPGVRAAILAEPLERRAERLADYLAGQIASVLGIEKERIAPDRPLNTLGLDSIMAIELKNRIERDLGLRLSVIRFLDGPTITQIAASFAEELGEGTAEGEKKTGEAPTAGALSHGQRALWFLSRLAPESAAYNVPFALRIRPEIETEILRATFQVLLERHPILRTCYVTEADGRPRAVVRPETSIDLTEVDATAWSEEMLGRELSTQAHRPFDLAEGPILRLHLYRRRGEAILLFVVHHIAIDFWSLVVLLDELREIFSARREGRAPRLSDPSVTYDDFIRWQEEMLGSERGRALWEYWREALAGEIPLLDLPTDRPRPPVSSYRGGSHRFEIPADLTEGLRELARREGTTLYTVLLSLFQILLHRYSRQDVVIVGSPAAGRTRPEFESVVGYFVNMVPLEADFSANPSFQEVLAVNRERVLGALEHQDFPFPLLVDRLGVPRDPSRSPLFQAVFVLEKPHKLVELSEFVLGEAGACVEMAGLQLASYPIEQRVSPFELTLMAVEVGERIAASLQYQADLFEPATIERMAEHFLTLVAAALEAPTRRVRELSILPEAEQRLILSHWNRTAQDFPAGFCVHHLFEMRAAEAPEAIAVVCGEARITYGELNRRANALAHTLIDSGVGAEVVVGVCMPRSVETIVALLGILKAGGAYLPIDPVYPDDRIRFMLEDAGAPMLLTQSAFLPRFETFEPEVVALDTARTRLEQAPWTNPNGEGRVYPENLAYVIYTSGSTGVPKGVEVAHASLLNLVIWHQRAYGVGSKDRATHLAGSAFDASVWEIWPYLAAGAALYMPDEETRLTPERLRAWLAEMGITICFLPTPLAEALLDEEWPEEIALQALLTGGDKLTRRPASTLPFQLVNHYGPTENTVVTTCVPVAPQGAGQSTPPPIGRPIANTQVYLLDGELNLVPIGVPGELYIGGAGLARGYLNRPDLTAERFIPNPFSERGGEVLYRTGDLGRYLPDGNIAFLGRIDEQVKIRGYRIELGEIEAVLARHPAVKESIVVVREVGGKLLCAYVVPRPEAEVTEEALLEHLGRFLPDYMLPHAILFLDRLPLTPNGKVDRAALPAPQYTQRAETHVAPRTEREEILARIFGEVLNLSSVGIYDNFFRLGGDSILAIQIVSRARQAGLQLTPTQIFQHQTIAELAVAATPARAVAAEQGPVVGEAPLTPIQHWFFAQDAAGRNHFNQAVLLELSGPFEAASLREALCAVVAHHDALRSRFFQDASGGWRQRFEPPGGEIPFIVEDLCAFEDADLLSREIEARAAAAQERLDPVVGPLLRAHLFEPGGGRPRRLLIVIHHLAIDAVSWRILLEDLLLAHEQIVRGKPVRLPPKTTSFRTWAERLEAYAAGPRSEAEIAFWAREADRIAENFVPLPRDFEGGENLVADEAQVSVQLDAAETEALLREVPAAYNTQINDALLTAVAQAFRRWRGPTPLLLDVEGHGREDLFEDVDLSRTVGWFTTIFPLLLSVEDDPGVDLKRIKEQLRALPHRGIGFGILRFLAGRFPDLPTPEVGFNHLGRIDTAMPPNVRFAGEESGPWHAAQRARAHLIEVTTFIEGDRLTVHWTFSTKHHRRETIERLSRHFQEALRSLIAHCRSPEAGALTPSDFPLAQLEEEELDELFDHVDFEL